MKATPVQIIAQMAGCSFPQANPQTAPLFSTACRGEATKKKKKKPVFKRLARCFLTPPLLLFLGLMSNIEDTHGPGT